ncbi:MAG: hypothetical protein RL357_1871, partial [Pseudomonadota bacterium]
MQRLNKLRVASLTRPILRAPRRVRWGATSPTMFGRR